MSVVVSTDKFQIADEERLVLYGIAWETYDCLMKDHEDRSAPRFTYNKGTLEIYRPSQKHEEISQFFEIFVSAVAEYRDLDIQSLGSTTFRTKKSGMGVEPDRCFYLQNAGNDDINLEKDPPPDLIIEVDVTSPSLDRFPIYALFGVPEIWRYSKEGVQIFVLRGKKYAEAKESAALTGVTSEILTQFLHESQTEKRSTWLKKLREWICSVN